MAAQQALSESDLIDLIKRSEYKRVVSLIDQIPVAERFSKEFLLYTYGVAQRALGNPAIAVDYYKCALRLNPRNAGTWSNLGNALKDMNLPHSSVVAHKRAIELTPRPDAMLLHNYGIALSSAGDNAAAEAAFNEALAIDGAPDAIRWDLARAQLAQKNYAQGFWNYQFRWASRETPPRRVSGNAWPGSDTNEPLFVYVEQGFGDYLQCVRFLPLLLKRVKRVRVEVKRELMSLMQQSFPGVAWVEYRPGAVEVTDGFVVSMVDLPRFFIGSGIPSPRSYLKPLPKPDLEERIKAVLSQRAGYNVGVIWSGSLTFKRNQFRSAPAALFNRLAMPGVNLYSLQMGPRAADTGKLPISFVSDALVREISDFNDTAHIVRKLDLVIMTCSSTVHLCGALGVPCWVLLDTAPHWLWGGEGAGSEWYDSLRLFRQQEPQGWSDVFDRVSAALSDIMVQP